MEKKAWHTLRRKLGVEDRLKLLALKATVEKMDPLHVGALDVMKESTRAILRQCTLRVDADKMVCVFTRETDSQRVYQHLKIDRRDRYPLWHEVQVYKAVFFSADAEVFLSTPSAVDYLQARSYALHMYWQEGRTLDMTAMLDVIA